MDLTSRNLNTQLTRLLTENIENTERITADPSENFRDSSIVAEQGPENSEVPVTVTRGTKAQTISSAPRVSRN